MIAISLVYVTIVASVFTYKCPIDLDSVSNSLGVWFDPILANEWEASDKSGDGPIMTAVKKACSGFTFEGYEHLLVQSQASSRCITLVGSDASLVKSTELIKKSQLTQGHCKTWIKYSQYCDWVTTGKAPLVVPTKPAVPTTVVVVVKPVKPEDVPVEKKVVKKMPRKSKISVTPFLDLVDSLKAKMTTTTTSPTTSNAPTTTATTSTVTTTTTRAPTCEECLDVKSFTSATSPKQIMKVWPFGKCWPICDAFNVAKEIREARKQGLMDCGEECKNVPQLVEATNKLIETCIGPRLLSSKNWRLKQYWDNFDAAERDFNEMVNLLKLNLNWGIKHKMDHWFRVDRFSFLADDNRRRIYKAAQAVWIKERR